MPNNKQIKHCVMCGRKAKLVTRWYIQENGSQEANQVCFVCADLHAKLIRQGKKGA